MKKCLLSFILSVVALTTTYADGYSGIMVSNGTQSTYYLFEKKPTVKYQQVDGVMNACLYVVGEASPVVSVPLQGGAKLSVLYMQANSEDLTGLDNVAISKPSVGDGKFLEDGNIIIIKNGKKYNVAGQEIK